MVEVLEYICSDFWVFLRVCILMMIIALWKPIEVNVLNGYWKDGDKEDGNK